MDKLLKFVLPKIEAEAVAKSYGRFIISPLETGFGVTVGNALRRVLLSSLSGAAVTSLRVSGVHHEFSPIPDAKEDMTTLILNVKNLRLRYFADEPVRLMLSTHGKSEITAADIDCPAEVEIINPELHLLTLDSAATDLDIEFVVERGRGYSPAEERAGLPIGQIPVDAIFAPVLRTSYAVQSTRIGQVTDYDRLVLEIWTDGTVRPAEALSTAAQIVVRHITPIAAYSETQPEAAEEPTEERAGVSSAVYDTPIEALELSMRAYNCLKRAGVAKVGEVLDKLSQGQGKELLAIRNFGQKSYTELIEKLQEKGYLSEDSETELPEAIVEPAASHLPLSTLDLSSEAIDALADEGITSVDEVVDRIASGQGRRLLEIEGFSEEAMVELLSKLREGGHLAPRSSEQREQDEDLDEDTED